MKGAGRIEGRGRVDVDGRLLETDRIVVATGSDATIPPTDGLREVGYWTNREATNVQEIPQSVVVLGGGPVGIELGQFLARAGARVTVVEGQDRLAPREDPRIGELILGALTDEGVDVRVGVQAEAVSAREGRRVARLTDATEVSGDEVLVAIGRSPRVDDVGLESVGIQPDRAGIRIDARCRAADGVLAIGDVTGVMPFTHVGMYQGRIAAADIAGRDVHAD